MLRIVEQTSLFNLENNYHFIRGVVLLAPLFFILSCVSDTRSNLDMVLSREAFNSANEVDAPKYSPAQYHKAEEAYRRAVALYKDGAYDEAAVEFRTARAYAEKAENTARVQRQKSGDEGL